MRRLHRLNALFLALFLTAHICNHIAAAIGGIDAHLWVMGLLRTVYYLPGIEPLLILSIILQLSVGLVLILRRGRPTGGWAWLQVLSGAYLVFFLIQHVPAVLIARAGGLDTNSYFAASVISKAPFVWYFAPYYALSIAALFTHIAAAIRFQAWPKPAPRLAMALPPLGIALGLIIVGRLMWQNLPPAYEAYLASFGLN